jgi:hypothetical protein
MTKTVGFASGIAAAQGKMITEMAFVSIADRRGCLQVSPNV